MIRKQKHITLYHSAQVDGEWTDAEHNPDSDPINHQIALGTAEYERIGRRIALDRLELKIQILWSALSDVLTNPLTQIRFLVMVDHMNNGYSAPSFDWSDVMDDPGLPSIPATIHFADEEKKSRYEILYDQIWCPPHSRDPIVRTWEPNVTIENTADGQIETATDGIRIYQRDGANWIGSYSGAIPAIPHPLYTGNIRMGLDIAGLPISPLELFQEGISATRVGTLQTAGTTFAEESFTPASIETKEVCVYFKGLRTTYHEHVDGGPTLDKIADCVIQIGCVGGDSSGADALLSYAARLFYWD